jgi:anti-anti-sigma factor
MDKAAHHYETIYRVLQAAGHYRHWPTLLMGMLAFIIMYGLKWLSPRLPNVLAAVVITTLLSWSLGFEHQVLVDVSEIRSAKVQKTIHDFNRTLAPIAQLTASRAQLIQNFKAGDRATDALAKLEARHAAERIALQIEQLKTEAQKYRRQLRRFLFEGVRASDGSLFFYPINEFDDRSRVDDREWRLKVGSAPLPTDRLHIIGGGDVVGNIPPGLPAFAIPGFDYHALMHLLPFAAIISLLGFMEAISVAKAMAAKTGQRLDPNRELIGQGLANICGAIAESYPTSGSFSRSAVNLQSGAVSGLSSVFTSLTVVVVLLFFTPLFYHLPQSVLAAIIMMAVAGLLNVRGFIHAWQAQWYDGAISIITFIGTLAFAPHLDRGILIGAGLSILVFLYKSMRPKVVDLSLDVDRTLHDAVASGLEQCRYIDVVRFDGPLFFANASYLEDQIRNRRRSKKDLKHIILSAGSISDIDSSGEEALSLTVDRVRSAGIDISLCGVNRTVMRVLRQTHLIAKIGEDHIYPTIENAINAVHEITHRGGREMDCPLTKVCRITRARRSREN